MRVPVEMLHIWGGASADAPLFLLALPMYNLLHQKSGNRSNKLPQIYFYSATGLLNTQKFAFYIAVEMRTGVFYCLNRSDKTPVLIQS
ncbi:MAG: hypothetical protein KDE47_08895 [Caldilineaceae bacterium]|nr:hypothetical protein [Caldilineaceae bacterium]